MTTKRHGFRISPRQQCIVHRQADTEPFEARLVVEIVGPLDRERLAHALRGVVAAHDILRTRFVARAGLRWPIQVIDSAGPSSESPVEASVVSTGPGVHLFTLRMPSLCADAHALGLMFEEIVDRYAGIAVPAPALQYAHYADWQLEVAERTAGTVGVPAPHAAAVVLPGEQTVCRRAVHDTDAVPFSIERARIDGHSERVLLAGWFALLGRLAGTPSVSCRVACAGRLDAELAAMLGPIDRHVAIEASTGRSTRFEDLVGRVAGALAVAERAGAVDEAGEADDAEVDIGFDFVELPHERRVDDTRFRVRVQEARLDRFKVRLSCALDADEVRCALRFDPGAFACDTVSELTRAYAALVRHAADAPAHPVGCLRLLDRAAADRVVALGAGPTSATSAPRTLHERFADQARRTPATIAVEARPTIDGATDDLRWTYAELAAHAEHMARRLRLEAVGPEVPVAVVLDPSVALIVALLAIHQVGGIYMPIDPRDPPRRLAAALAAVPPRVVITRDELVAGLPPLTATIVVVDAVGSPADAMDISAPLAPVGASPDHLAYVMFTSGSTGEPKAVGISHRALANYLDWCQQAYDFDPTRAAWVHSSASFDLGLTALIAPLVMGRRLRFLPLADRPDTLGEMLRDTSGLGLLKLTPSHLRALRHQLPAGAALDGVVLVVGGESLYHEDLEAIGAASRSIRIVNEYGPTEATVGCSTHEVSGEGARGRTGPVSIGRPIPGARMYVLDDELHPLPVGVKGALYIGGAGLARGYLGAPALTAERFVPDPFGAAPGMRLYRTGDVARLRADGDFEFFGRDDDQVKIRGHRVELGEIERALRQHPSVGEAAVLVQHGDQPGTARLSAFVAPRPGLQRADMPSADELRALIRQWLPDAVVPGSLAILDRLHRAPSGKLDRAALEAAAAALGGAGIAPRDELEQILAGVWSQVLAAPQIHIDDNFFALGGDSIRALQVVALARARFIELSLEHVIACPTLRTLAARARAAHPEARLPASSPFSLISPQDRALIGPDEDIVDAFPLAALQAGMIFHNDQSALYHDIFSYHIEAAFDEAQLRAAAIALVERHPAFRTTFDLDRFSVPLQLVHRSGPDPLTIEDLRHLGPSEQEEAIANHLAAERKRGLPVAQLPLIRFHVQRRSDTTVQFSLSFHHAVIDGWSDATMMSELFHDYLSALAGEPAGLTAPVANFRDFIVLEQRAIASPETAAFWDRTLAGSTLFRLPRARAWRDGDRRLVRRSHDLPDAVCAGIRALALELAVPVKTVVLAAHFAAMRALQGDGDVLTCMVSSGRIETIDGERVLGLFINSIPVRAQLDGGTWRDLVHEMLRIERELMPHRRLPLAELQRRRGGIPLSDALFYFTDYHVYRSRTTLPRLKLIDYIPHEETSFPLSVSFSVDPMGPGIHFELVADEARFERETIDAVESCVLSALGALTTAPDSRYEHTWLLADPSGSVHDGSATPSGEAGDPIYVLDPWMLPVPPGVIGRMYIGEIGVARGYPQQPALTAGCFVPNPFGDRPGARLRRTDELARRRTDGTIEACGPIDRRVRVRGMRVALGELEAALGEHSAIRAAAVQAFGEPESLVLAAYVASDDPALTAQTVRDHLLLRFPETVVPGSIVVRDHLPVTAGGEIDRAQLPDPRLHAPDSADAFEAPRTEVEQLIAALWAETLGLPRVGRRDNFFLIGGHSIVLVRVVSRLRKALQVRVPIRMLHDHRILADLASAIEELRRTGATQAAPSFAAAERPEAAPLSFVQEGIWQLERTGAAGPAYHIPVAIRIDGALDRGALAAALDLVVARHATLRTSFTETESGPLQRVLASVVTTLTATETTNADPEHIRAWMQAEVARPFDLAGGSVIRAALRSHGPRDHVLLLVVHHLAVDGWSIGVVFRDLVELYRARVRGDALALPPITSSYAAYAQWQRSQEDSAAWDGHREYWRARLAQLPPPLDLAHRGPRPEKRSYRGARLPLAISEDVSRALRSLALDAETTLYVVVLAAFKVVLAHRGAQRDIVVGTDVAGRELPGTEELVGCIVNQVVLRTRLPVDQDPTFRAVLALVRSTALEAYDHQDLPFELLLRELRPRREPGLPPVFQIKMVFQRAALDRRELPDVTFQPIALDSGASKWDLLLDVWDSAGGIGGALTYSEDLFDSALARHLIAGLSSVLAIVAAEPDAPLSRLEQVLTREAEVYRRALAVDAARTSRRLFERSLRARPAADGEPARAGASTPGLDADPTASPRRRARAVALDQELVRSRPLGDREFPLCVEPAVRGVDLVEWAAQSRGWIDEQLDRHGALLFRGFEVAGAETFERFMVAACGPLLSYDERSSPRKTVHGRVYTSTEYPADQSIFFHNENSYQNRFPTRLGFHCVKPAERGGETPLAHCGRMLRRIPREIVARFAERGWMCVRNYREELGLSWQEVFQTSDRAEVEARCRRDGLVFEWHGARRLTTRAVRPALARHPRTGQLSWFNHAAFFHVSTLDETLREGLLAELREDELPANTYYGDGAPLEPEALDEIRQAYQAEAVYPPWQRGDITLVDNLVVAHGRAPFTGPRIVLVAMAALVERAAVDPSPSERAAVLGDPSLV